MSKAPLFSTYRQGENRVTASMLAVFERIDLSLLEQLLGAASGESDLQMVRFRNQISGKGSVPDAGISAHFNYLFEVKTEPEAVRVQQLRGHLALLGDQGDQRLFVITPDIEEPHQVTTLAVEDARVGWVSFVALASAVEEILAAADETVSEREAFLLRELVRLFEADGLLDSPNDVVIVAAGTAYPFYQQYGLYVCQAGRGFSAHIQRMGFYRRKAIQPEVPEILWHQDGFDISAQSIAELERSGDSTKKDAARRLREAIDQGELELDWQAQVFLLSAPDDERTFRLAHPIAHDGRSGWTQKQRYVSSEILSGNPRSTKELRDDASDPS
ncbi:MAG: hypothetical protein F4X26_09195 [Chloroflexi bacterium]|nr:hypothetical protein [Chloroflexota bacterium]